MTFLSVDLASPAVLPADSIHRAAHDVLNKMVTDPGTFWSDLMHQALVFGLKVLAALVIYLIGYYAIRYVKKLLEQVFVRRNTERTLASFVISLVSIAMMVILIIITASTLGIDTTSLAALLAAGGMAIGMALSGTVQNFAGGIMLLVFKPFKSGDFIIAQGQSGIVVDVSITATKILTTDNRLVVLPNGALSNGNIENCSAQPLRRVDFSISVAYGADAAKFRQTVLDMFAEDDRILDHEHQRTRATHRSAVQILDTEVPDPFVALSALNDSSIAFTIRVWVRNADYWAVYFEYMERFYTELPKHGFSFAYPHMDVLIRETNKKK